MKRCDAEASHSLLDRVVKVDKILRTSHNRFALMDACMGVGRLVVKNICGLRPIAADAAILKCDTTFLNAN
ncbi:hypothetical protein EHE19_002780 [Ruminiclostridium herbifermentans]|uniref:Uncharacterized protein n=1 Tax=Ruminiclostridium herbifermentans TaxID=2488810 RepID=A0A7H1VQ07_9FIRM|nr:hypothetical protein EHE19_002780 [Ruminiclostridium herbifermentans]